MNIQYRRIEELAEALRHADALQGFAREIVAEMREAEIPAGAIGERLEQEFGRPETFLLVAEDPAVSGALGLCLTLPFRDPLTTECVPMIVVLGVQQRSRNQGIARGLVQAALAATRERGMPALAARAAHTDDALISMGERWGFVRAWEWMAHE